MELAIKNDGKLIHIGLTDDNGVTAREAFTLEELSSVKFDGDVTLAMKLIAYWVAKQQKIAISKLTASGVSVKI